MFSFRGSPRVIVEADSLLGSLVGVIVLSAVTSGVSDNTGQMSPMNMIQA